MSDRLLVAFAALIFAGCGTEETETEVESNTAPSIASVFVSPSGAMASDVLTCSWSGFEDVDGDYDLSTVAWTIEKTTVGEEPTLSAGFSKGDTVTCTVTPNDGTDNGEPISAAVTIQNSAPSVSFVDVSPNPAGANDTLTCTWLGFEDADNDEDQSLITWAVNGINAGTGDTFSEGFAGGDEVTCYVTPFDGTDNGDDISGSVTIGNVSPSIGTVTISPDPATASQVLSCGWADFEDADGDDDLSSATWSINGDVVGSGLALSTGYTGGDEISCTVIPFDGNSSGTPRSATVFISNSVPSVGAVTISPELPSANDTLTCEWTGFSDADNDEDQSKTTWSANGVAIGSGTTLQGAFNRDDEVSCAVTPFDGADAGTDVSASVTIGNTAPSVFNVTLAPDPATVHDALTCSYSFNDTDGDEDASSLSWSVNGVDAGNGDTLDSNFVGRDDVRCTVTPFDGATTGEGVSTSIIITNSLPEISSVTLSPQPAAASDTLSCAWSGWSDADGDSDQTRVSWTINGEDAGFGVSLSSTFVGGDTVECTATSSDGFDDGIALSDSVIIDNTEPTIISVDITPAPAVEADTLTCSWNFYDADDGDDLSTVSWTVNGVESGTDLTLSGSFVAGDEVACVVTPSDGSEVGDPQSTSVTINSPPTMTGVSITPEEATATDVLACEGEGYSDVDGDSDLSVSSWTINGASAGASGSLVSGFSKDDEVACTVMPFDGYSNGVAVSGTITIQNSAPSVAGASVSPADPDPGSTLTCNWYGYSDSDGDTDQSTASWTVDGVEIGTGATLDGGFGGNALVTCTVTAHDGTDAGNSVEASVTSGNTPPTITGIALSHTYPTTNDDITVIASGSDADGDAVSFEYAWYVNFTVVVAETTDTLSSDNFIKGQSIYVSVTPTDGSDAGTPAPSPSVYIVNTAPGAPIVMLGEEGFEDNANDLVCALIVDASDPDEADTITYFYAWSVDGTSFADADNTIDAADTTIGEVWECTIYASDDEDIGDLVTSSATIGTAISGALTSAAWLLTESPYFMADDASVSLLQTITIEPGVTVYGLGHTLSVAGTLSIDGSSGDRVQIEDLYLTPSTTADTDNPYAISAIEMNFTGGSFHPTVYDTVYGSINVADSSFSATVDPIELINPTADSSITGSSFIAAAGIIAGTDASNIDITNCLFSEQTTDFAVEAADVSVGALTVSLNSFLSTDLVALSLSTDHKAAAMTAISNWFNTTDTAIIDAMIYDSNDDASLTGVIGYDPYLTEADASTPAL